MKRPFMLICCFLATIFLIDSCRLYLAPSKINGAGRGIFAGEQMKADSTIEYVGSITFRSEHSEKTLLANYVFGIDDKDYVMLLLGSGSLYNFIPESTSIQLYWADEVNSPHPGLLHYSNMTDSIIKTMFVIGDGEELYLNYGESWLANRGWDLSFSDAPPPYTLSELQEIGACITDVTVSQSTIEGAGRGLFANRDFAKGEMIIVSPVLFLPMDIVYETRESSILMNYVWTEVESRVGFLPLGNTAMLNHPAYEHQTNNVFISWYTWGGDAEKLKEKLLQPVETLLDGHMGNLLDIAVYASAEIAVGEELFINYGTEWVNAWTSFDEGTDEEGDLLFRHPLVLPPHFLPLQWKEREVGIKNENDEEEKSFDEVKEVQLDDTLKEVEL